MKKHPKMGNIAALSGSGGEDSQAFSVRGQSQLLIQAHKRQR